MSISRGVVGALVLLLLAPSTGNSQSSSTLMLASAVAAVEEHNPELAAALLAAEVAGHRADQAGRWPNPLVTVYQERFPNAVPGADQLIVSVSQSLPIGGRTGIAVDVAEAKQRASQRDAAAVRAVLTLRVQQEYVELYAAQRRHEAIRAALDVGRSLLRDLELRNAEGDVSDFDVGRMFLEVQALEVQAAEANQARRSGSIRLEALTGLVPPAAGWEPRAPDAEPGGPPPLDEPAGAATEETETTRSLEEARDSRPEILAEMERAHQANLEQKLARRQAFPDLIVNAGYSRVDPGYGGFVLSIGAVVPLFDRNRDAAAAAAVEERRRRQRVEMFDRELVARSRVALGEYELATAALRDAGEVPGPSLIEMARVSYAEGEMQVVALLDTVRASLEAASRRIELERRRASSWFTWKWASGQTAEEAVTR